MIDISQLIRLNEVYVLVDADNVQLNSNNIKHITAFAKYFGRLTRWLVYGDWEKSPLNAYVEFYDSYRVDNIERIQVDRNGKNATDYYMMMNIGAIIGDYGASSGIFITISGDGIFASLGQFMSDYSSVIIPIGGNKKATSKKLTESYGKVYFLEDLEQELLEIQKDYPIPLDEVRLFQWFLRDTYNDIASKDWRWVSYNELSAKLCEKFPHFIPQLEKHPLPVWLSYYTWGFSIHDQMVQRVDPYPELTRRGYIFNAFLELAREDKKVHLSHLGKKIREIARNYDQEFGSKKLTDWIREYPDDFKIEGDYVMRTRFY